MKTFLRILIAAGALSFGLAAHADTYPSKPITIIVPFGPGSATDTIARVVAQHLGAVLKQSVVVEARPGANGALSALYVARSAPDGYTLFMSTNSPHSAAPFLMKNIGYDPVKDFTAITRMGSYTLMLCVHPSIPAKSVKELIEYAKANPGKLSFASGNTTGVPHVKAGTLRALAVTRLKRSTLIPELPTLDEAGVTGFDMDSWAGIFAPAGTPADIITLLNAELRKIIDSSEVKSNLGNVGFEAFSSSPKELEDFVKVQLGKWGKMVKDAGIQPD